MAAPVLTLTALTPDSRSFDVEALSGGLQGGEELQGHSGASWVQPFFREKAERGVELDCAAFGAYTSITLSDTEANNLLIFDGGSTSNETKTINYAAGVVDAGLRVTATCDQKLRTMTYIGFHADGTYEASATLSDGSATVSALTMPSNAKGWCQVTFRSVEPGTFTFSITRTAGASTGYSKHQLIYMPVPVDPAKPRGGRIYQHMLSYGGPNA